MPPSGPTSLTGQPQSKKSKLESGQGKSKGSSSNDSDNVSLQTLHPTAADSNASVKGQAGSKAVSVKSSTSTGGHMAKK